MYIYELNLLKIILDQLESPFDDMDTEATRNAKRFYKSCMNEKYIEENGERTLREFLAELGGWPLLNGTYDPNEINVVDRIIRLRRVSDRPVVGFSVSSNPKTPTSYLLSVSQPTWFFNKKYYSDTKVMSAYKAYIYKTVELLDAGATNPNYRQEIEDMFQLETEFANVIIKFISNRKKISDSLLLIELNRSLLI